MLKQRVKGRVENFTLASFLQLLEMERKTCALAVSSHGHQGLLYVREGHLVGAETAGLKGQTAALEIVTWENADIEISDHVPAFEPQIDATLRFLLMEGMRLKDERQENGPLVPPPPPVSTPPAPQGGRVALDLSLAFGEIMSRGQTIKGSAGLLLVDMDGGEVLGAAGSAEGVDLGSTMALPAAQFLRQERRVAERLGLNDPLQDVIVTTAERYYLIRVVGEGREHFLLLVLDRHKANLAKAQLDLVALERTLAG